MDEIPDVAAIFSLIGEERVAAEDILIARLATGDGRAAAALADADCYRAIPVLVEATSEQAAPAVRVAAARALLQLNDYSGELAMIRLLRTHAGDGFVRGAAARLLTEYPDPDREILLEMALTDPDQTARSCATDALCALVGLDDDEVQWGEVLLSVGGRLLSSLLTVRAEAMTELREIIARRDAAELATTGLAAVTGRERTLVDNLVLLRLNADRRAVRAAGTLGVSRAVEPLRELLATAEGDERAEIKSVLDVLTGRTPR